MLILVYKCLFISEFHKDLCHSCYLSVQLRIYKNTTTLKEHQTENITLQSSFKYDLKNIYSNQIFL